VADPGAARPPRLSAIHGIARRDAGGLVNHEQTIHAFAHHTLQFSKIRNPKHESETNPKYQ
jgi:hypothetical protein